MKAQTAQKITLLESVENRPGKVKNKFAIQCTEKCIDLLRDRAEPAVFTLELSNYRNDLHHILLKNDMSWTAKF